MLIGTEGLEEFHERVERLTGERWCPYPNQRFINISMRQDDETFTRLIKIRRTHFFPEILHNDPIHKILDELEKD